MASAIDNLLAQLGPEVEDHEEEAFLLFSQCQPSQNLGFLDAKATTLALTINNHDLTITQSPTVLSSNRSGGTTGAVVWKVTPLFSGWLSSPGNLLFRTGILITPGQQQQPEGSTILELGCGISGLVGLATAPLVRRYVLTDQSYVARLVEANIAQNKPQTRKAPASSSRKGGKPRPLPPPVVSAAAAAGYGGLEFQALDWETDTPHATLCGTPDVVVACDCIYNDALIAPLVSTLVEACRLKSSAGLTGEGEEDARMTPCVAVVAQQLRDPEIFEGWLKEFMMKGFRVWRVPDGELPEGLRESSGFVVHVGILSDSLDGRPR